MSSEDIETLKITDPSTDLVCFTDMKFCTYSLRWTIKNYNILSKTVKLFKSPKYPDDENETRKWYIEFQPVEITPDSEEKLDIFIKRVFSDDIFIEHLFRIESDSKKFIEFPNFKQVLTGHILYTWPVKEIYKELLWNQTPNKSLVITSKIRVFDSTQPVLQHVSRKICPRSFESSDLLQDISKLLENDQTFQDVTISVQGKTFGAHKNVLAARSEVFAAMFTNEMSEKSNSLVEIEDLTPEVIEKMLHFIYTDKVEDPELKKFAPELLAAAEKYNLRRLKEMCIGAMHKNLAVENVLKTLEVADIYSVSDLKKEALKFLASHRRIINSWDEFKTLIADRLHLVVELIHIQDNIPGNPSD